MKILLAICWLVGGKRSSTVLAHLLSLWEAMGDKRPVFPVRPDKLERNGWRMGLHRGLFGLASFQSRVFGRHQAKGCPTILLGLGGVEVGGGLVFGMLLAATPLHEQAVAQTAKHAHDPKARTEANAAAVVVVGNVQALVQPVFNAPISAVKLEPALGVELVRRNAGQQTDFLVLAIRCLAQQTGGLGGQGSCGGVSIR